MDANQAWIGMFRRIPTNLHDTLSLGLTTAAEIVVQRIVKLEPDFMIIRGRLAGTQDAGRVVVIPYSELTFVAVIRDLKESEIEAIFGKGAPAAVADMPTLPAGEESAAEASVVEVEPAAKAPKKPEAMSKSMMLAKLRERLKDAGQGGK